MRCRYQKDLRIPSIMEIIRWRMVKLTVTIKRKNIGQRFEGSFEENEYGQAIGKIEGLTRPTDSLFQTPVRFGSTNTDITMALTIAAAMDQFYSTSEHTYIHTYIHTYKGTTVPSAESKEWNRLDRTIYCSGCRCV